MAGTDCYYQAASISPALSRAGTGSVPVAQIQGNKFERLDSGSTWAVDGGMGPFPGKFRIPALKPNIYLYPSETTVYKVKFNAPGLVTKSDPYYDLGKGWKVTVEPGGKINGTCDFLFYDANVYPGFFQKNEGWILPVMDRTKTFIEILDNYGFNEMEKMDFIEFRNRKLDSNKAYTVYPQATELIDKAMPVEIVPAPVKTYRIWFYFISGSRKDVTTPAATEKIERQSNIMVEWGGMVE